MMLLGLSAGPQAAASRATLYQQAAQAQPTAPNYSCAWNGSSYVCSGSDGGTTSLFQWLQHVINASVFQIYGVQATSIPETGNIESSTAAAVNSIASTVGLSLPPNQLDQIQWIAQNAQGLANTLQSFTGLTPPTPTGATLPTFQLPPGPSQTPVGPTPPSSSPPAVYVCYDGTQVADMSFCPSIQTTPPVVAKPPMAPAAKLSLWAIGLAAVGAVAYGLLHRG